MKIWISDTQTPTHRLIRMNCEDHSGYKYLGDLDDDALTAFFLDVQEDMDLEKNMQLIKYFGYLHLFILPQR